MGLVGRIALSALRRPPCHAYGDDPSQIAELHLPRGRGPAPVAVVLHGGSWQTRYSRLVTRPVAQDLARRGWAAWNLEYRRVGAGGGWPATFEDVAAGIDALADLAHPRLDLGRVVAVGHSAGGQLALWAGGRGAPRVPVTRVAALAAVTDMARAGATARAFLGGEPEEVPDRYADADPLRRVPLPVPVLLVHALDDRTVSIARSHAYAAAARRAGGDVELVETASGGHRAPIDPGSEAWRAAAAWLAT